MSLLISESPLQVLPSLAVAIGLNEAMMLQQMHFWSNKTRHSHKGCQVFYKSVLDWKEEFPFWSESTIKRTLSSLKKQKLIFVWKNLQNKKIGDLPDRTNWFGLNYSEIDRLEAEKAPKKEPDSSGVKMTSSVGPNCALESGQNDLSSGVKMTQPTEIYKYHRNKENIEKDTLSESGDLLSVQLPMETPKKIQEGKFYSILDNRTILLPEYPNNKTKSKSDRSQCVEIPSWLDFQLITEFVNYREGMGKYLSGRALSQLINKLSDFEKQGYHHCQALCEAMGNGWQAPYMPKPDFQSKQSPQKVQSGFDVDNTSWADDLQEVI